MHRRILPLASLVVVAVALVSFARPAAGGVQVFQEACAGATLTGSDMLPITDTAVAGGDADFTVAASCQLGATAFSDVVVCFTPQNSCTVSFSCNATGGSNVRASIVQGPCAGTFASCLAAGTDVVPPEFSLASLALTAGQSFCFVCQNTVGNGSFNPSITETAGSCGALPVELESFRIEDDR
jgi:hypothetical protein